MSASRMFNAPEMSRTALDERSVGVASAAARRAFASCLSMCSSPNLGGGTSAYPRSLLSANERDEILIDLVLVRGAHAVRRALVDFELCASHDLGGQWE